MMLYLKRNDILRKLFLLFSIIVLSASIYSLFTPLINNDEFSRKDATGFKKIQASSFFYFYKTLGLYPLTVDNFNELKKLKIDKDSAKKYLYDNIYKLRMENGHWYRFGERARILALYPSFWLYGEIGKLSLLPFNTLVFIITVVFLFFALKSLYNVLIAIWGVILVVSSQFITYEALYHNNIFAIQPMLHIFTISLLILFRNKQLKYQIIASFLLAILIGFLSEIRGENITALLVVLLYWVLVRNIKEKKNILIVMCIICLLFVTKIGLNTYFDKVYDKTKDLVENIGGYAFNGARTDKHPLWHPLLAGLGDYGQDKGFEWNDRQIFIKVANYANKPLRIVRHNQFYDKEHIYYKRVETLDFYSDSAKKLFIKTILDDPLWYINIIIKRIKAMIIDIPPIQINLIFKSLNINFFGLLLFMMIVYFFINIKQHIYLKEYKIIEFFKITKLEVFIVLSALFISVAIILIYSGKGITNIAIYQYFIIIICLNKFNEIRLRKGIE